MLRRSDISLGDWTSLRNRRLLFAKHSTCFWSGCEMSWGCCVEIRNEEGWSLYGLNETRRAGTRKHADYRHYELRMCQWISARMCSLSQPDIYLSAVTGYCPIQLFYNVRGYFWGWMKITGTFMAFEFVAENAAWLPPAIQQARARSDGFKLFSY